LTARVPSETHEAAVLRRCNRDLRRWLKDGLAAAVLVSKDLPSMKGSDPRKLALAELLWKRTTVSQEWIAEKLAMRSAANVSQQLRRFDRAKEDAKLPPEMRRFLKQAWGAGV